MIHTTNVAKPVFVHRDEHGYLSNQALAYEVKALRMHYEGKEAKSWYYLLKKEEWRYGKPHSSSVKQQKQQRLWQELGFLYRMKMNLHILQNMHPSVSINNISFAVADLIDTAKQSMENLKHEATN
jgi:hypothetical protein